MKETKSYNFLLKLSVTSLKIVHTLLFPPLRRSTRSDRPSFFLFHDPRQRFILLES